jgi:hypothetical protein
LKNSDKPKAAGFIFDGFPHDSPGRALMPARQEGKKVDRVIRLKVDRGCSPA